MVSLLAFDKYHKCHRAADKAAGGDGDLVVGTDPEDTAVEEFRRAVSSHLECADKEGKALGVDEAAAVVAESLRKTRRKCNRRL